MQFLKNIKVYLLHETKENITLLLKISKDAFVIFK